MLTIYIKPTVKWLRSARIDFARINFQNSKSFFFYFPSNLNEIHLRLTSYPTTVDDTIERLPEQRIIGYSPLHFLWKLNLKHLRVGSRNVIQNYSTV